MLATVQLQIEEASNSVWTIPGRLPNETRLPNWALDELLSEHFLVKWWVYILGREGRREGVFQA